MVGVNALARYKSVLSWWIGVLNLFGSPAFPVLSECEDIVAAEKMINDAEAAKTEGIEFTEVMSGYIYLGDDIQEFDIAAKQAEASCENARFFLTVHAWNMDTCKRPLPNSGT